MKPRRVLVSLEVESDQPITALRRLIRDNMPLEVDVQQMQANVIQPKRKRPARRGRCGTT